MPATTPARSILARGRSRSPRLAMGLLVAALMGSLLPGDAAAQLATQVAGLSVEQAQGFATLRWTPVADAVDYEIERTPIDDANAPTGLGTVVGVWRPSRQLRPEMPAFADAGFDPGDRFQWRVRARFTGGVPGLYSDPVFATTLPRWGDPGTPGESLRTQWETSQAAQYTSDTDEFAYTDALDAASDRMRVVEIGQTVQLRPIDMYVFGYPEPLGTPEEIRNSPTVAVNCIVHGNEPSSREACFIMARELAFSDDPRIIDILSNVTVLLIPSLNGDGRAANTRGNITGQDLNRDHSLLRQPETFAFSEMVRDYQPDAAFDGHEFGNSSAGDLPVLVPRHLNVAQSIFDESMNLMEGWLYEQGSDDGWWYCPYGCQGGGNVGLSQETILRNLLGLKNTVAQLLEARSSGGSTRPDEGNTQNNRRRKTYSALYTFHEFLDYYRANQPRIQQGIDEAIAFQESNTGPIVWRGSRDMPQHPAPHPGQAPPPEEPPTGVLDPAPCGYRIPAAVYSAPLPDGPSIEARLGAHGIASTTEGSDVFVPMRQPLRGLIPLILDGAAAEPIVPVGPERVPCGPAEIEVSPDSMAVAMAEDDQRDEAASVANTGEADAAETLTWEITEAATDCGSPSDLSWVAAAPTDGTTNPGEATDVTVTFDSTGIAAPAQRDGLLCVSSNDPDDPVVEVSLTMTVEDGQAAGLRGRKEEVRNDLAALPAGTRADDARIEKAIGHLDASLQAKGWEDDDRLEPKHGKQVFDRERAAVKELGRVADADVSWAIEELVEIDEQLAQTAIDDAGTAILMNATGDPRELERANRYRGQAEEEMDKGRAQWAEGNAEKAIEHYGKAWEYAQKAIAHAEKA